MAGPTLHGRRAFVASLAACGIGMAAARAGPSPGPVVATTSGRLRGIQRNASCAFLGIPYGAPPTGEWRFRPPQPAAAWTGIRDALAFGPMAIQSAPGVFPSEAQGEDCLVLNVYTPVSDSVKRPVMVYLHGGGYGSGSGGAQYDGQRLAEVHDVVLVTINHRLNVLGFLDLSDVDERYLLSGNSGLLDVVLALQWVSQNIAAFGGDAGCVTIFGQSGGGGKVSNVLAMPGAAGLFHRAIPMSGAVTRALTPDQAFENRTALCRRLGIGPRDVEALVEVPPGKLVEAMTGIGATGTPWSTRTNFGPVVDGHSIVQQPCEPAAPPCSARVPVLLGSTHDETRLFYVNEPGFSKIDDSEMRARLVPAMKCDAAMVDAVVAAYRKERPGLSPADLFLLITTQYMFSCPSALVAERMAARTTAPAWLYRFDWVSPGPIGQRIRAAHAVDVPLVFDLVGPHPLIDESPARSRMATLMSNTWTRFARTGDPNGVGLPRWPRYDSTVRSTLVFDNEPKVLDDPAPELRLAGAVLPAFHP